MMRFSDYLWDFDGTLADSYPHTASAFCECVAQEGIVADRDEAERLLRTSLFRAYERYGLTQQQIDHFIAYEKTDASQPPIRLYPGAEETLRTLHAAGARHFLVTHRDGAARDFLQKLGIADLFTGVVTKADGFPYKPAPDSVLYLLKTYGIDPSRALMVGDRELDIACGHNAGVAGCLVIENQPPEQTDAEFCIYNLRELL